MLAIDVRILDGAYDAASSDDPRRPEWPPSPARLFCALVASGPSDAEWSALRWLEGQDAPEVWCSDVCGSTAHRQFVITNETKAGSPLRVGRIAALRVKPSIYPSSTRYRVRWPNADPPQGVVDGLAGLCRRVAYVGRSTSFALVELRRSDDAVDPEWAVWEPADLSLGTLASHELAVPYPTFVDRLRQAHGDGRPAWGEMRRRTYRPQQRTADEAVTPLVPSQFALVTFSWTVRNVGVAHTAALTDILRKALMSRDLIADPKPAQLSGHGADDRSHVAVLGLPNVGAPGQLPDGPAVIGSNPNADGRLMGLGVAVPLDMPDDDLQRMGTALSRIEQLALPSQLRTDSAVAAELTRARPPYATRAVDPQRWRGPSTVWATATPVVFDRFPAGRSAEQMVAEALVTAGFPVPARVVAQRAPILPGALQHSVSSVMRRSGARARPFTHAWVAFDEPVEGPVIAGSMRYRGLGLFAPMRVPREAVTS